MVFYEVLYRINAYTKPENFMKYFTRPQETNNNTANDSLPFPVATRWRPHRNKQVDPKLLSAIKYKNLSVYKTV